MFQNRSFFRGESSEEKTARQTLEKGCGNAGKGLDKPDNDLEELPVSGKFDKPSESLKKGVHY